MATSRVEPETGIGVVVGCVALALLGAYMWVLFAQTFASAMGTSCGEGCTTQADPGVDLGIYSASRSPRPSSPPRSWSWHSFVATPDEASDVGTYVRAGPATLLDEVAPAAISVHQSSSSRVR